MLAEIGFLVTGVCFAMFAYTFKTIVIKKTKLALDQFAWAYLFLALALVTWGIAVSIGGDLLLRNSVYVGDFFLLCGTLLMADLLLGKKYRYWMAVLAGAGLLLLNYRIGHYVAQPRMNGQVLLFNTQTPVAIALGLMFVGIWLPANLKVAKQITHYIKEESLSDIYSYIYIAATISALVFIASRRVLTVVLSFVALGVCFLMLLASNMLVEVMEGHDAARKRRKPTK
jgi:hypothetical protein